MASQFAGVTIFGSFDQARRVVSLGLRQSLLDDEQTFAFSLQTRGYSGEQGRETGRDFAPSAGTFSYQIIGDVTRPVVSASVVSAKRGKTATLRYRVQDDNPTSEVVTITRGGKRIARVGVKLRHFVQRQVAVRWRVPKRLLARGPLRYCVIAEDESRNKSAPVCARLVVHR